MLSSEHLHSPLLTSRSSDVLYNQWNGKISSPLTTIVSIPSSTPSVSTIPSIQTTNKVTNEYKLNQYSNDKRRSTRTILMANVSRKLRNRKVLHNRQCKISNVMCFLGVLGVILMIMENEITFQNVNNEHKYLVESFRLIISITTIALVGLVFYYHYLGWCFYAINNSLDHWRIGLTKTTVFLMFFEAFVCMIHPIFGYYSFISNFKFDNSTISNTVSQYYTTMDVALGLPMFARVYLICRSIMFHSHLVRSASSQALGSINKVSLDFYFLMKTYLTQWPVRCLLGFCICLLLMGSWSLRACNYISPLEHLSMQDAMWLFIVTFTTVGYGDLIPSTYCGRSVAAIIALIGVLSTALLISVVAQKLQFTRSEKYLHNFVLNIQLVKERKDQSAKIIQYTMKLWYRRRKYQQRSDEYIDIQRKLFRAMHINQRLKQEKRKLDDICLGWPEIMTTERQINTQTHDNSYILTMMKQEVDRVEEKLVDMNQKMINMHNTLELLLNKITS